MEIKYYIVNNVPMYFDILEKELDANNISFVRIENEIHFSNKIVRIIDKDNLISLIIALTNKRIPIKKRYLLDTLITILETESFYTSKNKLSKEEPKQSYKIVKKLNRK